MIEIAADVLIVTGALSLPKIRPAMGTFNWTVEWELWRLRP